MTVGIVGLGLIGGSMARAFAEAGRRVLACELDAAVLEMAELEGVAAGPLDAAGLADCELLLLALYPQASVDWLSENAAHIPADALVVDCCGVKRAVCAPCFALAERCGFTFVGGHPMAGSHNGGFKHSRANLFKGASMVLVPPRYDDPALLQRVKDALAPAQFGRFTVTNAEEHDRMIAFTSQLAHVVSNAYIKSPTALAHRGFSAGSYKDLTRVAKLSETMWTELFLENADMLAVELDCLIGELEKYRSAIRGGDADTLKTLLAEGSRRKQEVDG